ncbi:MAG: hypothetical protein V4467_00340 [Patescibacteria group bacterium]
MSDHQSTNGHAVLAKKFGSSRPAREEHGTNGWSGGHAKVFYIGHGWVALVTKDERNSRPHIADGEAFVSRRSYLFAQKVHGNFGWKRGGVGTIRQRVMYHYILGWVSPRTFWEHMREPDPRVREICGASVSPD